MIKYDIGGGILNRKVYLSIAYVVCLVLLFSNLPFALVFEDKLLIFIFSLISELIALVIFFHLIKKENIKHDFISKFNKKYLLFIPFLIICFSNFFVVLYQNSKMIPYDNYENLLYNIILCIPNVIIEELLFRYLICYEFNKHTSKIKSIIYSSLIFASIHLLNISSISSIPFVLVQVIYTFGLGLVLSLIYLKSNNNIIYPIILHLLFNIFNDIIVVNLFNFEWNLSFFVINGVVTILSLIYSLFIYKVGDRDAS